MFARLFFTVTTNAELLCTEPDPFPQDVFALTSSLSSMEGQFNVTVQCLKGYTPKNLKAHKCANKGHPYTISGTCEAKSCSGVRAPTNGDMGNCTNTLASDALCSPGCNVGYTVSGTTRCHLGTLIQEATCEEQLCKEPNPFPQDIYALTTSLSSMEGQFNVTVHCLKGYTPKNLKAHKCTKKGHPYTISGTCEAAAYKRLGRGACHKRYGTSRILYRKFQSGVCENLCNTDKRCGGYITPNSACVLYLTPPTNLELKKTRRGAVYCMVKNGNRKAEIRRRQRRSEKRKNSRRRRNRRDTQRPKSRQRREERIEKILPKI